MMVIGDVQNWWRRRRPQDNAIVCVPIAQWPNDIIRMLSDRLPHLCEGLADCYIVNVKPSTLRPNAKQLRSATLFAFFAHPDDSYQNFAVNLDTAQGKATLTPEWWSSQALEFNMIVAHVCQGARILARPEWKKVFPNWVSYKSDVCAFVRSDADEHLWAGVAKEIVAAAIRDQKASALKNRIRSIYYEKMADVDDGSPTGRLQAMLFQAAVDALVSSEEASS